MARKRMFTNEITDSDAFIEMSSAAQALYFHLNQGADDDGFNNQIRNAMFKAHASIDDLKILMAKNYIIRFECGVIVIKHWRLHNTIRKDRYKPTNFQEELKQLGIKDNGSYTFGCQTVAKRLPQVSTVEVSIDENSIVKEKEKKEKNESQGDSTSPQQIADLYNSICISFPSVRTLSDTRKKTIKARLKTFTLDDFKELFEKAESSSFLKGDNPRKWKATFDWLIKDANIAKVLDGNYNDQQDSNSSFDLNDFFNAAVNRSYGGRAELERGAAERMEQKETKTVADDPELMDRLNKLKKELQG